MSEKSCSDTSCDKSSCEDVPARQRNGFRVNLHKCNEYSCVRRVIGVVSGKGGVGKSMVTASLANEQQRAIRWVSWTRIYGQDHSENVRRSWRCGSKRYGN